MNMLQCCLYRSGSLSFVTSMRILYAHGGRTHSLLYPYQATIVFILIYRYRAAHPSGTVIQHIYSIPSSMPALDHERMKSL